MESGTQLLRMRDVALRLKVSEVTVARMVKDGRLRAVRIGKAVRVPVAEVEAFVRASEGKK